MSLVEESCGHGACVLFVYDGSEMGLSARAADGNTAMSELLRGRQGDQRGQGCWLRSCARVSGRASSQLG